MIRIRYTLIADGFTLVNPVKFGCIEKSASGDTYAFFGGWSSSNDRSVEEAVEFLVKLLCEGVRVDYKQYWMMQEWYNAIEALRHEVHQNKPVTTRQVFTNGSWIEIEMW